MSSPNRPASLARSLTLLLALPLASCQVTGQTGDPGPSGQPNKPGNTGTNQMPGADPMTGQTPPPATKAPYEPLPPAVYASKVKDLITGLPLTDEELATVSSKGRDGMKTLIDAWMATPQFKAKMFDYFKKAFQQTQLDRTDLEEQLRIGGLPGSEQNKLLRAVEESFTRTALAIVEEGRPFTETVTTTRFAMNLPLMVSLAYMDAAPRNDLNQAVASGFWLLNKFPKERPLQYVATQNIDVATGLPVEIPLNHTLDPNHPNFMKFWYPPPMLKPGDRPCTDPGIARNTGAVDSIYRALFGARPSTGCNNTNVPSHFSQSDWDTWRMVTVRAPRDASEERTIFWELDKLRDPNTNELVLGTPRVGFMTTPAFFANWATNPSNSYRVTTNQTLIVALGRSFDDRGTTVQVNETSVDSQHVTPGTVCFGCHQTLDPMRDYFKMSYSLTYSQQLDLRNPKNPMPVEGVFAVDGSPAARGQGIHGLAKAIVEHPRFAVAWTQKLCQLANAVSCVEDEPEFKRVADAFVKSKFNFKTLVRELFASPLVTFAERTATADANGVVMSIARRDAFCDRVSNRLGIKDLCNQSGEIGVTRIAGRAKSLSLGIPGSGYSRADEAPLMPHDPNMFFVSGTEKLCAEYSMHLFDGGMFYKWKTAEKDAAINDFVSLLMGVPPSDPRTPDLRDVLQRHYAAAVAAKEKPVDALRSTFVLACASPLGVSSGL